MRTIIYWATLSLGWSSLWATPLVDPQAWVGEPAPVESLLDQNRLELPAEGQLFRGIGAGNATLTLHSSPVFAIESEDVALLEFGSNAIAFTREGEIGRLTLVQLDQVPQVLDYAVVLGEDFRPVEPLAMTITQRGGDVFLTVQNQIRRFRDSPLSGSAQIVLSAGASEGWSITQLGVTSESLHLDETSEGEFSSDEPTKGSDESTPTNRDEAGTVPADGIGTDERAVLDPEDSENTEVGSTNRAVRLEVFTPSAVRRSRSAEVRAALRNADLN